MMRKNKKNPDRLRIAFAYTHNKGWPAGTYYLKNLFFALRSLSLEFQPEIFLLVRGNATTSEFSELASFADEILYRPPETGKFPLGGLLNRLQKKTGVKLKRKDPLNDLLKSHGMTTLFTRGTPPSGALLPFVSWIPDFQHHHFPEFFDEQERLIRDRSYECVARLATRVVLSSECAKKDFARFAPWASDKARVLSFVAQIPVETFHQDPGYVFKKYNIPERFILLPNQFWKHKNHETVILALQAAIKADSKLTVVCTGNTNESRDFNYFSTLLCRISKAGIRERMIILGLTPRQDFFSLMRQSVAVLQPSLFEGWNTAIEEARSMGKRLIVSDIPVHREQNAPGTVYFDSVDADSLASALLDVYINGHAGPDLEMEARAKKSLINRTSDYGKRFIQVVREAAEDS